MRLLTLLILILSFALNCIALDVILNPYQNIEYEEINSYQINAPNASCNCDCTNYQENYSTQDYNDW